MADEHRLSTMPSPESVASTLRQPDDLDTPAWKYLSLGQFVWLLLHRQLWLAPLTRLGDRFEGIAPPRLAHEVMHTYDLSSYGVDTSMERSEALHDIRSRIFVSCWHLSPTESALMWGAHAPGEGVVLQTTYRRLRASAGPLPIGLVDYFDYTNYSGPYELIRGAWLKRREFESEREVRIGLYRNWLPNLSSPKDGSVFYGMPMDWPLEPVLQGIRVHPESDYDHCEAITTLVRRLAPELKEHIVCYSALGAGTPY